MDASAVKTLFIVGPTASGKTGLSIDIAKAIGAEIVCADSQTVRRYMDIGTAKPTVTEQEGIPHHMLDIINPYDDFNLADYLKIARHIIQNIHREGKTAIIVGGTGLYIDALYFQFELPKVSNENYETFSAEELTDLIAKTGLELPRNAVNKRHLINTLRRSGSKGGRGEPLPGSLIVGLLPEREKLVAKINDRVDAMFLGGFIEEVKGIVNKFGRPPKEFDAIGYRIAMRYLDGDITAEEAKELFKIADRQYARRQVTWLKRNPNIQWFDSVDTAKSYILDLC